MNSKELSKLERLFNKLEMLILVASNQYSTFLSVLDQLFKFKKTIISYYLINYLSFTMGNECNGCCKDDIISTDDQKLKENDHGEGKFQKNLVQKLNPEDDPINLP